MSDPFNGKTVTGPGATVLEFKRRARSGTPTLTVHSQTYTTEFKHPHRNLTLVEAQEAQSRIMRKGVLVCIHRQPDGQYEIIKPDTRKDIK